MTSATVFWKSGPALLTAALRAISVTLYGGNSFLSSFSRTRLFFLIAPSVVNTSPTSDCPFVSTSSRRAMSIGVNFLNFRP